jgi:hypothetical protein
VVRIIQGVGDLRLTVELPAVDGSIVDADKTGAGIYQEEVPGVLDKSCHNKEPAAGGSTGTGAGLNFVFLPANTVLRIYIVSQAAMTLIK